MVAKKVIHKLPKTTEKSLREMSKRISKEKYRQIRKMMKEGVSLRMAINLTGSRHLLKEVK